MQNQQIQTLKGFRDFLPVDKRKRDYLINKISQSFQAFGFVPLETPSLEYASLLLGKYGEEADKLVYTFKDQGDRKVALRYDQTVPLARVIYENQNQLTFPFKRYQIQPVWRGEKPQKGRYREFLQCDIDILGTNNLLSDAEIILCVLQTARNLGFENLKMLVNNRSVFKDLEAKYISTIDKLEEIGEQAVVNELIEKGMEKEKASTLLSEIQKKEPTEALQKLFKYLEDSGLEKEKDFEYQPTLARGLDYYTGTIFELVSGDYTAGSLGGGGRYDKLIGSFFGKDIAAVGFAFGFDRLIEAMEAKNLFPSKILQPVTQVLVTIFAPELTNKSLETASELRKKQINTELYLNEDENLSDQLDYANEKNIPWVIILGKDELEKDKLALKNMQTGKQELLSLKEVISKLKNENQN